MQKMDLLLRAATSYENRFEHKTFLSKLVPNPDSDFFKLAFRLFIHFSARLL